LQQRKRLQTVFEQDAVIRQYLVEIAAQRVAQDLVKELVLKLNIMFKAACGGVFELPWYQLAIWEGEFQKAQEYRQTTSNA